MTEIITADYFPGQDCHCEARSSYECGCDADWTPVEVYKLREDAKQLADRLTALELYSTSELARLEQERDDAREDLEEETKFHHRTHIELIQTQCKLLDMEMQRDEARDDASHWKIEYEIVVSRLCGVKHDRDNGVIFEHEIIPKLQRERDEAREKLSSAWQSLRDSQDEVLRLTFENRELSQSIEGWENKWKCAIDMAARAELERDEALKCAKEYYVEFIRNASSDNKVSKPNPLNPFYKY